jgi:hypothetical protein
MDYLPQMRAGMSKWEAWLDAALSQPDAQEKIGAEEAA